LLTSHHLLSRLLWVLSYQSPAVTAQPLSPDLAIRR